VDGSVSHPDFCTCLDCMAQAARQSTATTARLAAEAAVPLESTCGFCGEHLTLRLGEWMDDCYGSACTDTSAPYVPHKPKED
jgi:hypothetical protein